MVPSDYSRLHDKTSIDVQCGRNMLYGHKCKGLKVRRIAFGTVLFSTLLFIAVVCFSRGCHWKNSFFTCQVKKKTFHDDLPTDCHPIHTSAPRQTLPNALIIGVRKAGTGATSFYLRQHPLVRIPYNELSYFDSNYEKGDDWYRQQFNPSYPGDINMEKTSNYFHNKATIERIYDMDPNMKLIVVVRDPIDRVVSDFIQRQLKHANEETPESFGEHVVDFTGEINDKLKIIKPSIYFRHMKKWLIRFPTRQMHVVDGDKLIRNPYEEVYKMETFLNIPHCIPQDRFVYSESKGFFCVMKKGIRKCLPQTKGRKHPDVDSETMNKLKHFFRPYNEMFFHLVNQTFDWKY